MLRTAGPEVYDQWVKHEIPFNDPQVVEALDKVGAILKNADYVNGGLGEVQSIATTGSGGRPPILDGSCGCTARRPSTQQLAGGHQGRRGGDVFAFYLPTITGDGPRSSGAASSSAPSTTSPATQALPDLPVTRQDSANIQGPGLRSPGWVSANTGLDVGEPEVADRPARRRA